jgi:hypothetical protein
MNTIDTTVAFDTTSDDETAVSIPSPTITPMKASSILQGMWDVDELTSSLSSFTKESEENDSDERHRIDQVASRLLELVDQMPVPGSSPMKEVDQTFLETPAARLPVLRPHTYPCKDSYSVGPTPPIHWPQAPIMLRPTPNTQMTIRGIRYANSSRYQIFPGLCAGCILPINTGYELPGQSYVIDFESTLFIGTLLVRVKGAKPIRTTANDDTFIPNDKAHSGKELSPYYFDGKKRQFQVMIKGRFKKDDIPMNECVTGQAFDRPAGKLPARFMVNTFIKFIATLAPQLEVELDSNRPRFLSPLISTAHTVIVKDCSISSVKRAGGEVDVINSNQTLPEDKVDCTIYAGSTTMEDDVEEPPTDDPSSIMTSLQPNVNNGRTSSSTILQRRATRKKAFNRLAAVKESTQVFNVNKEYTFEFFQHLLLLSEPDEFKINMGHNFQIGLTKALNGQPIKILAARRRTNYSSNDNNAKERIAEVLWSFDLWHESLLPSGRTKESIQNG